MDELVGPGNGTADTEDGHTEDGRESGPDGAGSRPMMYRHQVADHLLYDQVVWGEGGAFHARPRRTTVCGIVLGRLDDPQPEGADECPACALVVSGA